MKWETPFSSAVSRREPLAIQTPTETERTCDIVSVMTLIPLGSVVVMMSRLATPVEVSCVTSVESSIASVAPVRMLDKEYLFRLYHFRRSANLRMGSAASAGPAC